MPLKYLPKFLDKLIRKERFNQNGAIPLLVLVAVVGTLAFLAVSYTAPFKEGLFGSLYPKPTSRAATTFTETFTGAPTSPTTFRSPNWDISYEHQGTTTEPMYTAMDAQHGADCTPPPGIHRISGTSDEAVFQCKDHVMTAIDGSYGLVYLTPNHMVDFSQGEAVVSFDVSTMRKSDRDWFSFWITPYSDALQTPALDWLPDLNGEPDRAIHSDTKNTTGGYAFDVHVLRNHQDAFNTQTKWWVPIESLMTPDPKRRDKFELRVSKTHIKFCLKQGPATDPTAPKADFCWVDIDVPPGIIDWDQGVVQFGHHSYNPTKGACGPGGCGPNTWHWDNVNISPAVPFTMIPGDRRTVDAGTTDTVNFPTPAPVNSNVRFSAMGTIQISTDNGTTWINAARSKEELNRSSFASYFTPIPAGVTSVKIKGQVNPLFGKWQARDISIWSNNQPPSAPTPPATPTPPPTPTPPATPTPISTPTPAPTTAPSCPATGGNLLQNNGFECSGSGWTGTTNGGRSIVTTPTHTGSGSQQMLASSAFPRQITQSVPVTTGNSYALSGWININGIEGPGASLKVNWLSSTGAILSTSTTSVLTGSNNWTQISSIFTAPSGAASAQVAPTLAVEPDNTGTAWFDDISLTQSAATPTPTLTPTPTPVPSPTPAPEEPGDGLTGQYFDKRDFTSLKLTRVDPTINFNWGSGSPAVGIESDTFSVRWTGKVKPQFSQLYTFYTTTDDGVRLWVNGVQIINKWSDKAASENSGSINLEAGKVYNIKLDYYENKGFAVSQLRWSSPSQAKQIIPQDRLYSK